MVDLTLEGITGPADDVERMFHEFDSFRVARCSLPVPSTKDARTHVKAVEETAASLRQQLPNVLSEILPDSPRARWGRRPRLEGRR